jgi:hypothetical protein
VSQLPISNRKERFAGVLVLTLFQIQLGCRIHRSAARFLKRHNGSIELTQRSAGKKADIRLLMPN